MVNIQGGIVIRFKLLFSLTITMKTVKVKDDGIYLGRVFGTFLVQDLVNGEHADIGSLLKNENVSINVYGYSLMQGNSG